VKRRRRKKIIMEEEEESYSSPPPPPHKKQHHQQTTPSPPTPSPLTPEETKTGEEEREREGEGEREREGAREGEGEEEDGRTLLLGRGTHGSVYRAGDFARKTYEPNVNAFGMPAALVREWACLRHLWRGPQIVKLVGVDLSGCCLVMPAMSCDLATFLADRRETRLPPHLILRLSQELLSAVAFCEAKGIMHRDIKPQNLLLSGSTNLVLCDFGLSAVVGTRGDLREARSEFQTLWYRAPEALLGGARLRGRTWRYGQEADAWSVGIVICELFLLRPITPANSHIEQIFRTMMLRGSPGPKSRLRSLRYFKPTFPNFPRRSILARFPSMNEVDPGMSQMVDGLLEPEPSHRLSARRALESLFSPPPSSPLPFLSFPSAPISPPQVDLHIPTSWIDQRN